MAEETGKNIKPPVIGLLALKNLLITNDDLKKAVLHCKDADNPNQAIKDYFLSSGLISQQNMERLMRAAKAIELRQKELQFGLIATQKGYISQSVLKLVMEEQENDIRNKRKVRFIGDMMVEAGMLKENQRDYILKLQERVSLELKKAAHKNPPEAEALTQAEKPAKESGPLESESTSDTEETSGLMEPEFIMGGIKLEISKDLMAAFLTKTQVFDDTVSVDAIKTALQEKGIIQGLVEDKMIEGFIRSSGFKTKAFRVARGVAPVQGRDARLEFFFNTNYLKAGGLTETGAIDFKERGEIPFVEAGTVLAEKTPMVKPQRGRTIFGDEIDTSPGKDIVLKYGKGAKLSEDGHKILAAVNGFPKYALTGHVFVHQEYITQGDVDYETGHVLYDGNVNVKGRIKTGFKVTGNDIQAIEVDGGIISAEGDVKILGGISEAKVYARGNVRAKYIHKSEIICMGNVVAGKEIVDADIECSGCCIVDGKLISSRITAKMGVNAKHIGTEMAGPSEIRMGQDTFTLKELDKIKEKLDKLHQIFELHKGKKEKYKEENLNLQKQITELAHIQDRSQLEQKELHSKISTMGNEPAAIRELQKKIEHLQLNAKNAEKSLDAYFDQCDKLEVLINNEEKEAIGIERKIGDLIEERNNIIKWAKENPGKPMVVCEGVIMPETLIKGRYAEKRITEMIRHARLSEIQCTTNDGQPMGIHEIHIGNI